MQRCMWGCSGHEGAVLLHDAEGSGASVSFFSLFVCLTLGGTVKQLMYTNIIRTGRLIGRGETGVGSERCGRN